MKVSQRSVKTLGGLVTGDSGLTRYRTGPNLVDLFNEYGADEFYGQGFPSRWVFAEDQIRRLNDSAALASLICEILDPREFLNNDFEQSAAVAHLNDYLPYDGYEVVITGGMPKVRALDGGAVELKHPFQGSMEETHQFIQEQLVKAEDKVRDGDFDGAVTNGRSLLEAVLLEIVGESEADYDGDLPKLYKRVQKLLNLDPARPDVETPIKQVLSGFTSVVSGIAGMSNKMGDRHARSYRPARRHSVLVVNAVKTLVDFLLATHWARSGAAPANSRLEQTEPRRDVSRTGVVLGGAVSAVQSPGR